MERRVFGSLYSTTFVDITIFFFSKIFFFFDVSYIFSFRCFLCTILERGFLFMMLFFSSNRLLLLINTFQPHVKEQEEVFSVILIKPQSQVTVYLTLSFCDTALIQFVDLSLGCAPILSWEQRGFFCCFLPSEMGARQCSKKDRVCSPSSSSIRHWSKKEHHAYHAFSPRAGVAVLGTTT